MTRTREALEREAAAALRRKGWKLSRAARGWLAWRPNDDRQSAPWTVSGVYIINAAFGEERAS